LISTGSCSVLHLSGKSRVRRSVQRHPNTARVYTPADTTVQTPNSDTPYSFVGLDLRAEPLVLTLPAIEKDRYYSVQFVDQYTFNVDYVGTRTTGNGGGKFLIGGRTGRAPRPPASTK